MTRREGAGKPKSSLLPGRPGGRPLRPAPNDPRPRGSPQRLTLPWRSPRVAAGPSAFRLGRSASGSCGDEITWCNSDVYRRRGGHREMPRGTKTPLDSADPRTSRVVRCSWPLRARTTLCLIVWGGNGPIHKIRGVQVARWGHLHSRPHSPAGRIWTHAPI
jgi:hypothetical protein